MTPLWCKTGPVLFSRADTARECDPLRDDPARDATPGAFMRKALEGGQRGEAHQQHVIPCSRANEAPADERPPLQAERASASSAAARPSSACAPGLRVSAHAISRD
jgi:hypothetical protein